MKTKRFAAGLLFLLAACAPELTTKLDAGGTDTENTETCGQDACPADQAAATKTLAFYTKYFPDRNAAFSGANITMQSDGVPAHPSPYFDPADPLWEAFDTMGGTRWQNPNRIVKQTISFAVPITPEAKGLTITSALVDMQATTSQDEYHGNPMGLCLDGVSMFHGVAAPGDDISQEEHTFDRYEGHPQKDGVYHHHSGSPGPLEVLKAQGLITTTVLGQAEIEFFGVMCDGTLVLGCTELDGSEPDASDFDAQNGHVHDIQDAEDTWFTARYHTHVCRPKYTTGQYAPEIQYYKTCGTATQGPPPPMAHDH